MVVWASLGWAYFCQKLTKSETFDLWAALLNFSRERSCFSYRLDPSRWRQKSKKKIMCYMAPPSIARWYWLFCGFFGRKSLLCQSPVQKCRMVKRMNSLRQFFSSHVVFIICTSPTSQHVFCGWYIKKRKSNPSHQQPKDSSYLLPWLHELTSSIPPTHIHE